MLCRRVTCWYGGVGAPHLSGYVTMSSLKVVDNSAVDHSRRDEYLGGEKESRWVLGMKRRCCLGCSFSLESGGSPGNGLLPHWDKPRAKQRTDGVLCNSVFIILLLFNLQSSYTSTLKKKIQPTLEQHGFELSRPLTRGFFLVLCTWLQNRTCRRPMITSMWILKFKEDGCS